jgi:ribonuclease HI
LASQPSIGLMFKSKKMDLLDFFQQTKQQEQKAPSVTLLNPFNEKPQITYPNTYKIIRGVASTQTEYATLMQFDGAAEPNPGPACGAAVLLSTKNGVLWTPFYEGGVYKPLATNNMAEYDGLILGLQMAIQRGIKNILIEGDSALVVSQTTKEWQVKDEKMKEKQAIVQKLLQEFTFVGIRHVLRNFNRLADALSKEGIMKGEAFLRLVPNRP